MASQTFTVGTVVRLRNKPSCAGQITGDTRVIAGRTYFAVRLADGTGIQMLPAAGLVAEELAPDPMEDLARGRFGDPTTLRRLLLHHRLTGRLRDVIYSMDVTDTEFHAYQFKPVIKLLGSPSQGLLIADEVGLGKTIEAGLIWTELVARFDTHRLLVICPKSLTEKWRLELWQKFSVDAKIVGAKDLLHYLQREPEGGDGFALIASLSSIRPPRDWEDAGDSARAKLMRFLSEREGEEPIIDCLVFDEAHHLRNSDTMGHIFARQAMEVTDYKLLLSATPINLRSEDLRNLLRLLDRDTFEDAFMFERLAEENRPLVAAREKALSAKTRFEDLLEDLRRLPRGEVLKIDRQLDNLLDELGDPTLQDTKRLRNRIAAQLEEMSLLGSTVNRTRRRDVNDLKVERRVNHHRWSMTEEERAFYDYVSDIVRDHAWSLNAAERFLLATPQRLIASSLAAACAHWGGRAADDSLDDPDQERETRLPLVAKLSAACEGKRLLQRLEVDDTKLACLLKALRQNWAMDPAEKIIVFSSFRVTLNYLQRRLRDAGIATELMHGGIKEERTSLIARFQAHEGPRVLLTSEVGGEGLDIQFCRSLINYDLPWNPMKVEQRIGRIDRIGQKSPSVAVVSLICADTIEEQIYDRLYQRLLTIEATLGSFEAVLGAEIAGLEQRLLDPALTAAELKEEIARRAFAIEERQRQERVLEEEAPGLIAHGDMILDRIEENHRPERQINGAELADYVHEALSRRYPGTQIVDTPGEPGVYDVLLSEAAHLALKEILTKAGRARTRLSRQTRLKATFGRRTEFPKSIERITTVHPLVRLAAEVRKKATEGIDLQPVACIDIGSSSVGLGVGHYVAVVEKWFVDGAVRVDRLAYAATALTGDILDERAAENLVQVALREGRPGRLPPPTEDTVAAVRQLRQDVLRVAFDDFVGSEAARHEDRAATGLARIEQQREKRARDVEWKLSEWKHSGDARKLRLIPAEQAKLKKLLARLDFKREQLIEALDRFSFQQDLVGLLILNVEGSI